MNEKKENNCTTKGTDLPIGRDIERQVLRMNSYMGFLIHAKTYGIRWRLYLTIPQKTRDKIVCANMRKYQLRDSFDNTLLTAG